MVKKNQIRTSILLLLATILTGCGGDVSSSEELTTNKPLDYEFTPDIANVQGGTYYEILVRTFADSDDDGIGDLNGVTAKLPYLKDLGVGGIWLLPIHPSPSYHGYDVEDYKAINEEYGSLADFDKLIEVANENGIDVIIDLVINHSSKTHPWFKEGYERFKNGNFDKNNPDDKANWYNFEWRGSEVAYEAGFGDWMPDLNLENPSVRTEIESIVEFWLDRGVSGFRLDAVTYYYKNMQDSINFLSWFNGVVKTRKEDAYIVGEAWKDEDTVKNYYRAIDSLFNFEGAGSGGYMIDNITYSTGSPFAFRLAMSYEKAYDANENARIANFLTNHDMDRSSQMYVGLFTEERQKLAASIYLLTPGIPFIYYGEEIGIKGTRGSAMTDANRRLPMIWERGADPWRPDPVAGTTYPAGEQVKDGVKELLNQPFSLLNHYKKVINIRNQYPWLLDARVQYVNLGKSALAGLKYTSKDGNEKPIYVVHNFTNFEESVDLTRLNAPNDVSLFVAHDIFTDQRRAESTSESKIILPRFSSLVIEER